MLTPTELRTEPVGDPQSVAHADTADTKRQIGFSRLSGRATSLALAAAGVGAIFQSLGTVVIGRVAETPESATVVLLAVFLVGAALLDTIGRVVWNGAVDRAEGRLRADLLHAVMHQPLSALTEHAVGEILDRVDDDTHEIGALLRRSVWRLIRLAMLALPLFAVAGFTWWPAFVLFPLTGAAVFFAIRPVLIRMLPLKVLEEEAWSDHAAAMEEAVAARDDLRTSHGRPYVLRRCAELSSVIHTRLGDVVRCEAAVFRRSSLLLHGLLGIVAIAGVAAVAGGAQSIATLVTLFAVTVTFVGQIDQASHQLPDLQAGVGALIRLRGLMAVPAEPSGGAPVPNGPLSVEVRDLDFGYPEGSFALAGVSLTIPAGSTCALVGRSGSGKSTLASLLPRALEPPPGTVFLGGVDIVDIDLHELRSNIGLVTQRTEILAGTLAENIAMFADLERDRISDAVAELGLEDWVAALPDGLDTRLGPAGVTLSAGEEQLVAFARLLVCDVRVIVLDEATARMDPVTEQQVVAASQRLLAGRTGVVIAHRLGTTERADRVAVLDGGRVVEQGRREELTVAPGAFRELLEDAGSSATGSPAARKVADGGKAAPGGAAVAQVGSRRRVGEAPTLAPVATPPSLGRGIWNAVWIHPQWGIAGVVLFLITSLVGAYGAVTGWLWGNIVVRLESGEPVTLFVAGLVTGFVVAPLAIAEAIRRYPQWWIAVMLRVRTAVLIGQTDQRRLPPTPPGETVARAMDSDRYVNYADRWVDFANAVVVVVATAILGGTWLAGAVLLCVMVVTALTSAVGTPAAGRSAAASSTARAGFGRSLVSALDSIRTVKLSAATSSVHRHLQQVDGGRVDAAVREHRVQGVLDGIPVVLVQAGVVAAWGIHVAGGWGLSTALLVSGAVAGFEYFGRVAGWIITEAPGTRAWQQETSRLAGGRDLVDLPDSLDLVHGTGPSAGSEERIVETRRLERLELSDVSALHDDGTIGVEGVDLVVERGELVLLVGRIGSGKSTLLSALAGLVSMTGRLTWNDVPVTDPEVFLRPERVAYVAQIPRVLSGSFVDNIRLDHDRDVAEPISLARLGRDIDEAGGTESVVGHRGVRLSGGQVQRVALARALATGAELLVADDVSSALDATTEIELWEAMRASGRTVLGASNKRAALARADRVVVLDEGRAVAQGRWADLAADWDHLAG